MCVQLPPEVGQLRALTSLDVLSNSLTSVCFVGVLLSINDTCVQLPPEVGQLRALTSLDVSGNSLTSVCFVGVLLSINDVCVCSVAS
jgi:Leucine-rich repeat (LRR) protein